MEAGLRGAGLIDFSAGQAALRCSDRAPPLHGAGASQTVLLQTCPGTGSAGGGGEASVRTAAGSASTRAASAVAPTW